MSVSAVAIALAIGLAGVAEAQPEALAVVAEARTEVDGERESDAERQDEPVSATGGSQSASVGLATNGRLSWGVRFDDSPSAFVKIGSETSRHGTAELVGMVARASASVATAFPGSRLMVGDLSHRLGGRLSPHDSHRAGRDVDLGFYLTDARGDPAVPRGFVGLNARGLGRDRHGESYRLDVARNWALIAAILTDETVHVQFILINARLKRLLREHARRTGVDRALIARFEEVAANRSGSGSHRSHFHVRIYCASDDRPRCIDAPPFHASAFDPEQAEKRLDEWREAVTRDPSPRVARRARRARWRGMRTMRSSTMMSSSAMEQTLATTTPVRTRRRTHMR